MVQVEWVRDIVDNVVLMSAEEWDAFNKDLDDPPPPDPNLIELYRQLPKWKAD